MTKSQEKAVERIKRLAEEDCRILNDVVKEFTVDEELSCYGTIMVSIVYGPASMPIFSLLDGWCNLLIGKRGAVYYYINGKKVRFEFYSILQAVCDQRKERELR